MTKNQRQCQNGGKSWDDLIYRTFLPNNISNETSTEKADKWYLSFSAKLNLHYWAEISLCSQTSLLPPLSTVAQCRIKPTFFFSGIWNCGPMCQTTLPKDHTGRQWQNPVPCFSYNTTKEVDLFGRSLINWKCDHILSFLDSNEWIQNLCILSGLKWWSGRKHKSGKAYY